MQAAPPPIQFKGLIHTGTGDVGAGVAAGVGEKLNQQQAKRPWQGPVVQFYVAPPGSDKKSNYHYFLASDFHAQALIAVKRWIEESTPEPAKNLVDQAQRFVREWIRTMTDSNAAKNWMVDFKNIKIFNSPLEMQRDDDVAEYSGETALTVYRQPDANTYI